jgi:hypothetical protein
MRAQSVRPILQKALIFGVFCALVSGSARAVDRLILTSAPAAWEGSPFHEFSAPEPIWNGRAVVRDEGGNARLGALLSAELQRLSFELHDKEGWRLPVAAGDPLRIFIARKDAGGLRRVAARVVEQGHLVQPTIQLDATGLSDAEIVHQVGRLFAVATLAAYNVADGSFLTTAAADYLSHDANPESREAALADAAAPEVDVVVHASSLGRLFVEEFARETGGPAALRAVWETAAETAEPPLQVLLRRYAEGTGAKEEALMLRFATRLYATLETDPSPSRVSFSDLQTQGLDAAAPAVFAMRHRVLLSDPESAVGALRVSWPDQGSGAAAVVRYRDAALPADVVYMAPGATRTVPLAGVARVDFVVAGSTAGPPLSGAVALVEGVAAFPFAGLSAQALSGPGGPHVSWTTASHEGLAGWAVFREEVLPDGRIARSGPEIIPSSNKGDDSFRYVYVDSATAPGTYYRYTVWAVTEEGLLARAFSATLKTE